MATHVVQYCCFRLNWLAIFYYNFAIFSDSIVSSWYPLETVVYLQTLKHFGAIPVASMLDVLQKRENYKRFQRGLFSCLLWIIPPKSRGVCLRRWEGFVVHTEPTTCVYTWSFFMKYVCRPDIGEHVSGLIDARYLLYITDCTDRYLSAIQLAGIYIDEWQRLEV